MNFLQTVKNSIYSPEFYKSIPQKSFGAAIGYFALLTLLLALLSLIPLYNTLVVEVPKMASSFLQKAIDCYPSELQLMIKNGEVSTNVKEPYFITTCGVDTKSSAIKNIAVIDTTTPFSTKQFQNYKTAAWITKDTVFFYKDNNEIESESLRNFDNVTINKTIIDQIGKNITPYLSFAGPVLIGIAFVGLYIGYWFRLVYLLILALLIMLLTKIMGKGLSYPAAYKMGIYAMTLGFILNLVLTFTTGFVAFRGFPFMFTAVTLVVVLFNFISQPSTPVQSKPKKK